MRSYTIELIDKIPILITGDQRYFIIDTGSPDSFSEDGLIYLDEKAYSVSQTFSGADTAYLKKHIDERVNGLIGMNILSEYNFHFDYSSKLFKISTDEEVFHEEELIIKLNSGGSYPGIDIDMGGQTIKALVDTGSKFTYVHDACLAGLEFVKEEADFSPIMGALNSSRYSALDYTAKGKTFSHDVFYNHQVAQGVGMLGYEVLLGYDFLRAYPFTFRGER